MKSKVSSLVICTMIVISVSASLAQNLYSDETSSNTSVSSKPKNVLLYYGNGGSPPWRHGDSATFYDLQAYYNSTGYPTTYSPTWPSDINFYKVIFLIMPGDLDDSGTYYFTSSQISDIQGFLGNDRRLVVMGEHSGIFGANTVNDLLSKVAVGIRQNFDNVLYSIAPAASNITGDQLTQGVNDLDMDGAGVSSLTLSGSAKSLVRDSEGHDIVAVDNITSSPARPGGDVLVFGDTQVLDNHQLRNGDGDGYFDNYVFADNIVNFNGENEPPVADAGEDQFVNEGEIVHFNGSASYDPNYDWHRLEIDFSSDAAIYLRTLWYLGPYNGLWEGAVQEWVDFTSPLPFWIGKKAGHLGQMYTGQQQTQYWKMHTSGDFTLNFIAANGYYYANIYDETIGIYLISGQHVPSSTEVIKHLEKGHVYRLDIFNTYASNPHPDCPNDLDVAFKINEVGILLTPNQNGLVYYNTMDPLDLATEGPGVTEITYYSRNIQEFFTYYSNSLKHSEVEVGGGELNYNWHPHTPTTGITPGSYSDTTLNIADELMYAWDFDSTVDSDGDGDESNDIDATGPTPTHVYGDDGTYTVTLRVTNDAGLSDTDTCSITVNNVAPAIDSITGPSGYEGAQVTITSVVLDPGSDDLTFTWDWGDGTTDTVISYYNNGINPEPVYDPITNEVKSPMGTYPFEVTDSSSHTYGDNGDYTITVTVEDDDGGITTDSMTIKINNVAPTISSMNAPSGNEGSIITFTAQAGDRGSDDLTFTWEWGDGTSLTTNIYYNDGSSPDPYPSPLGTYPFSVTDTVQHTYGDDGTYIITLTVSDDDGSSTTNRASVVINNVAPTITLVLVPSGDEGLSINFSAIATDPGSDDLIFSWDFEYGPTIDNIYYNNGISTDPDISPQGVYPFSASDTVTHSYGDDYDYNLILTVTDDDDGIFTYTTTISIDNVAPSIIELAIPYMVHEGTSYTFKATAKDLGSDDLTFAWDFGDSSPIITNTYYNDGISSDPYPSPEGNFPFTGQDILDHTYGDDYNYTFTLTVSDDDNGITTITTTIPVNNVAPTIESFGSYTVDENTPLDVTTVSTDLGSDDLTFIWDFDYGPTYTNIFYNDGVGPDPYPSPSGIYPFSATDHVSHTYGDNGVFLLTLTVKDDDGGSSTYTTNITVKNVEPVIEKVEAYMYANISLRVAGEKYHSVDIYLYEDDSEIWTGKVTRNPGSPDEQKATISNVKLNITKKYSAKVDYLPNDPRINGNVWGANPVWIIMTFEDGSESRLHHTFNVRKSYWNDDHWNHIDPWEVELNPLLEGHNLTLEAQASDIGSDDLTFTWSSGNITIAGPTTHYNNGVNPDPYPSPEINPMKATDICKYLYTTSGTYTLILTVEDDDGGICVATLSI